MRRTGRENFEADRIAEVALRKLHAQRLPQVMDLALVNAEVGVACDPELREAADLASRKYVLQMGTDHRRQQHERLLARNQAGRKRDHSRQHTWHLEDRGRRWAPESILAAELQDEVEGLVQHLRERVGRIEPDRRQQRLYFAHEVLAHPCPLGLVALGVVQHDDVAPLKRWPNRLVEQRILLVHEGVRPLHDFGIGVSERRGASGLANFLAEVGNSHLEEFVEVGGHDADVAQSLCQGNSGSSCHGQHAFVERKHRQLPV